MNKKRIVSLLLIFAMVIGAFPINSLAEEKVSENPKLLSIVEGDYEFDETTQTITKYNGEAEELIIPKTIGGVSVKHIGNSAFSGKKTLVKVTVPEGVETIGKNSFMKLPNLKEINLPSTLKSIDFSGIVVTSLETLVLPEGLEVLSDKALMGNAKLKTVNFPDTLKTTGPDLFMGNKSMEGELVLGSNLEELGRFLFRKGSNDVTLRIAPKGKKLFISEYTFGNLQNNLDIPQGRQVTIKARAFTTTEPITLDFGTIEAKVGTSKEDLIKLLKEKVQLNSAISENDFQSLSEGQGEIYEIPVNWNSVDVDSSKEQEVSIEASFSNIPEDVMTKFNPKGDVCTEGCPDEILARTKIVGKVKFVESKVQTPWVQDDFTYEVISDKISKYKDSLTITGLSEKGKAKLETDKDLVLPNSINMDGKDMPVLGVGENAFKNMKITSVKLPDVYPEQGNFIIRAGAFADNEITELTLPEATHIIDSYAFKNNSIGKLHLPANTWKVGNEAFAYNEISDLTISDEVNLIQLDNYSFAYNQIKSVDYPFSAFKTLGYVFRGNPGMEPIKSGEGVGYGKVYIYTRNPEHLSSSTYIKNSEYQEFILKSEVDRQELYNAIKKASSYSLSQYTEESSVNLLNKLDVAREVMKDYDSTQDQVDKATSDLNEAISGLTLIGTDKTKLNELIKEAQELVKHLYTDDSWAELSTWLEHGKDLSLDPNVTKGEVDHAVKKLSEAMENLEVKPEMQYNLDDFIIEKDSINGFTASGKDKFEYNKDVVLPSYNKDGESIKRIGDDAFPMSDDDVIVATDDIQSPEGMRTVVFPEKLEQIGKSAFKYNALESLDFPKTLKSIGMTAFNGNQLKGELTIPDSVTEIGNGAFSLNLFTKVNYSKSMEYIPDGCFARDIYLTDFEIPEGVKTIGSSAFQGAPFKELVFPSTLEKIDRRAFMGHRMEKITIPGNVKEIGPNAFEHNKKFKYLRHLVLEEGVEDIKKSAFAEGILDTVNLPNSLKSLHKDAFKNNIDEEKNPRIVKLYTRNPEHLNFPESKFHEIILVELDTKALEEKISEIEEFLNSRDFNRGRRREKQNLLDVLEQSKKALNEAFEQGVLDDFVKALDKAKRDVIRSGKRNDPSPTDPIPVTPVKREVDRISGRDRVETSIEVSKKYFNNSDEVIIVDGYNYSDALSAGGFAGIVNAPILQVGKDGLRSSLKDEIKRLGAKNAIIIGGDSSVNLTVENDLKNILKVEMIAGKDRYETSKLVAQRVMGLTNNENMIVVDGKDFPDALSSSGLTNKYKASILLVKDGNDNISFLKKLSGEKVIVGGRGSVSVAAEKESGSTKRIYGKDRYETSLNVLKELNVKDEIFLASGREYADALSIAPVVHIKNSSVLLVDNKDKKLKDYLDKIEANTLHIIGGDSLIGKDVLEFFKN
ncbi:leucine-rich repeat protein [Lagierella sp.]|uniref:leucine-rich repeat protein n=1 Tax=Lagierella sp. TaxID=2849657 RepID=UPI0026125A8B|nr:leucine-rich repeat protein [Lagierella sp.]